jgi:DhnA family fructose-bisphosphate aldolase class Ia
VNARLNRLFRADGRCVDVAVDHGFLADRALLGGIEDIGRVVRTLAEAAPDAVQLSPGQAPHLQRLPGPRKPALVLRTDFATAHLPDAAGGGVFSAMVENAVGQAVALDAACVVVNLLLIPGEPRLHEQCVRHVNALRAACDEVAMPLMVEALAMQAAGTGYGVDGDLERIVTVVRHAVELGADVVKADPSDDLGDYHLVIEAAGGRPVLPRGGGRVTDEEVLRRTEVLVEQGAAGVVYGRNVFGHERPGAMVRALSAIVHDGAQAEDALTLLAAST